MMQKLAVLIALTAGMALALPAQAITHDEICARYEQIARYDKDPVEFQILSSSHGIVTTLTLGFPKTFRATLSGLDVTHKVTETRPVKCGDKEVGTISVFNLKGIRVNTGYFQIESGPRRASKPLSTR